jgi:hypothetical protein
VAVVKKKSHSTLEVSAVPKTGANNSLVQVIELDKIFFAFGETEDRVLRK